MPEKTGEEDEERGSGPAGKMSSARTGKPGGQVVGRLVLAGAGHAHMAIMEAIPALTAGGHTVTVVGMGERHYYSGMGPGMLGGLYLPDEISFPVRAMVEERGGVFIRSSVTAIDAARRLVVMDSGADIPYDVLSCNLGSFVPLDMVHGRRDNIFPVKPIENLFAARKSILRAAVARSVRIGVCGGGPAAFETAGNAWVAAHERSGKGCRIQIFAGKQPLRNMSEKVRKLVRKIVEKRDMEVFCGSYVESIEADGVHLENGQSYQQDVIVMAPGVRPSPVFTDSSLPTGRDGGLLVNEYLQGVENPDIFGGGDCIFFEPGPLSKVGVYAVRQNPVLLHNVRARLAGGGPLEPFDPGGSYLLILNMGGRQGILQKNRIVFGGRVAFWIKDHIDRRFIRRYRPK